MPITTDDCKKFIASVASAHGVPTDGWKRTRKTKSDEGLVRQFDHASGSSLLILEDHNGILSVMPNTPGAALGSAPAAKKTPNKPLPTQPAPTTAPIDTSIYLQASVPQKAAMIWVDFTRALAGKPPLYTTQLPIKPPLPWARVKTEWNLFDGKSPDVKGDIYDFVSLLLEAHAKNPQAQAVYMPHVSWAFANDDDYLEKEGHAGGLFSSQFYAFGTHCADEELGSYPHPFEQLDGFCGVMEGCYELTPQSAISGRAAMNDTYTHLTSMGAKYDIHMQKELAGTGDEDEEPLHRKVYTLIDALAAQKESRTLTRVMTSASATPAAPSTPKSRL